MHNWLRYVRIAYSVGCGIACVIVLALWIWSYRSILSAAVPLGRNRTLNVEMLFGRAYFDRMEVRNSLWHIKARKMNAPKHKLMANMRGREIAFGFGAFQDLGAWVIIVPHWFLVTLLVILATLPWFRLSRRFSLRMLLIVVTLMAVSLGVFSYFGSRPALPPFDVGDFPTSEG